MFDVNWYLHHGWKLHMEKICTMLKKASKYVKLFENYPDFMLTMILQKLIMNKTSVFLSLKWLLQHYKICAVSSLFFMQFFVLTDFLWKAAIVLFEKTLIAQKVAWWDIIFKDLYIEYIYLFENYHDFRLIMIVQKLIMNKKYVLLSLRWFFMK